VLLLSPAGQCSVCRERTMSGMSRLGITDSEGRADHATTCSALFLSSYCCCEKVPTATALLSTSMNRIWELLTA
jgi:hypothetical protein